MSADLSELREFASLNLQAASSSSSPSGSATPNGGEGSSSSASSPPSTSPIAHAATGSAHHPPLHPLVGGGNNGETSETAGYEGDEVAAGNAPAGGGAAALHHNAKFHHTDFRRNSTRGLNRNQGIDPNERRTVFIPNLPRDTTQRELNNMFAFWDGFIKVQPYDQKEDGGAPASGASTPPHSGGGPGSAPLRSGQPLTHFGAFVLFETPAQALAARDRLQGYVFDASASIVLQAKIALKNLHITRDEADQHHSQKSSRRGSAFGAQPHGQVIPPPDGVINNNSNQPQQQQQVYPQSPLSTAAQLALMGQPFSPLLSPQPGSGPYIQSGYGSPALSPYSPHTQLTPPALQSSAAGYYTTDNNGIMSPPNGHPQAHPFHPHAVHHANGAGPYGHPGGVFSALQQGGGAYHRMHHGHSHAGPHNPPCTTLFIARMEQLSNEDLYQLLMNSFGETVTGTKFMIDSKGQRIAFVEFDCIENASAALPRIAGYLGLSAAFSKNPLNVRVK